MTTFGFIGAGNMARAIVRGAIETGTNPLDFVVTDAHAPHAQELASEVGVRYAHSNHDVAEIADFVVLAVKPQVLPAVLEEIREDLASHRPVLVSIAAGVTLDRLASLVPERLAAIRVMPNVNAMIGAGMAAVAGNDAASEEQVGTVMSLFRSVGDAVEIPEKDFSAYTALAGSSPSWAFMFVEALTKAGVKHGLARPLAARIAAQAVAGSARLVQARAETHSAAALSDMVCSPGGTTIAGLLAAEAAGFSTSIVAAVDATVTRDRELGA